MRFVILRLKNLINNDISIPSVAKDLLNTTDAVSIGNDWIIQTEQEEENIIEGFRNLSTDFLLDFILYISSELETDIQLIRDLLPIQINGTEIYDQKRLSIFLIKNDKGHEFNPFIGHEFNREIMETVKCFLENDMNVSKTSEKMYLHRNTLIQRLDKFKRDTGYDLKKFEDAFITYYYIVHQI